MNNQGILKSKTIKGKSSEEMDENTNKWFAVNHVDVRHSEIFVVQEGKITTYYKNIMFWGEEKVEQTEQTEA